MKNDGSINRQLAPLPGTLDGRNTERAGWAEEAVDAFQRATGTDDCDALADLLCDVMHLCDRCSSIEDFDTALRRARAMYVQEAPRRGSPTDGAECDPEDRAADLGIEDDDLAVAAEGDTCAACERPSINCSRAPCAAVEADRAA